MANNSSQEVRGKTWTWGFLAWTHHGEKNTVYDIRQLPLGTPSENPPGGKKWDISSLCQSPIRTWVILPHNISFISTHSPSKVRETLRKFRVMDYLNYAVKHFQVLGFFKKNLLCPKGYCEEWLHTTATTVLGMLSSAQPTDNDDKLNTLYSMCMCVWERDRVHVCTVSLQVFLFGFLCTKKILHLFSTRNIKIDSFHIIASRKLKQHTSTNHIPLQVLSCILNSVPLGGDLHYKNWFKGHFLVPGNFGNDNLG